MIFLQNPIKEFIDCKLVIQEGIYQGRNRNKGNKHQHIFLNSLLSVYIVEIFDSKNKQFLLFFILFMHEDCKFLNS